MARATSTKLNVVSRTPDGSRGARRLRRDGLVPGVVYGGGAEPFSFEVDARELRLALAASGAVLDVSVDGGGATPVVLKDTQQHPVRGQIVHVDLLRVRLDRPIHAVVVLELTGVDETPGIRDGGVLEQITHQLNIEALPNEIPESIVHDVGAMEINDTIVLGALTAPAGVTLLDEPDVTIAILSPPRLQSELDELEAETEVVGETAPGGTGGDAESEEDSGDDSGS
jgi:large subunit ribosomal protein L25